MKNKKTIREWLDGEQYFTARLDEKKKISKDELAELLKIGSIRFCKLSVK